MKGVRHVSALQPGQSMGRGCAVSYSPGQSSRHTGHTLTRPRNQSEKYNRKKQRRMSSESSARQSLLLIFLPDTCQLPSVHMCQRVSNLQPTKFRLMEFSRQDPGQFCKGRPMSSVSFASSWYSRHVIYFLTGIMLQCISTDLL